MADMTEMWAGIRITRVRIYGQGRRFCEMHLYSCRFESCYYLNLDYWIACKTNVTRLVLQEIYFWSYICFFYIFALTKNIGWSIKPIFFYNELHHRTLPQSTTDGKPITHIHSYSTQVIPWFKEKY